MTLHWGWVTLARGAFASDHVVSLIEPGEPPVAGLPTDAVAGTELGHSREPVLLVGDEALALVSARGRLLAVMFAEREGGEVIRIISARLATRHERRD
jgi:hypothetical protein